MQKNFENMMNKFLLIFDLKLIQIIMGKVLRDPTATFYSLHHQKGKSYTFKYILKKGWIAKDRAQPIRRLKQNIPNMDISLIIIMFDNLKQKIYKADENDKSIKITVCTVSSRKFITK